MKDLVGRRDFAEVLEGLSKRTCLGLDSETLSLRPHHGGRLFSIILAESAETAKYFNFWPSYPGIDSEYVLARPHLEQLRDQLFHKKGISWFAHHALFDLHFLAQEGIEIAGDIWCTLAQARVEYNEHFKYDLNSCLERIGLKKDDRVKEWLKAHKSAPQPLQLEHPKSYTDIYVERKESSRDAHFEQVPLEIIVPYGLDDAKGTFALGMHQVKSIATQSTEFPPGAPTLKNVATRESRLTKTLFRMERRGIKIDRPYCEKAVRYETDRQLKGIASFKISAGRDYSVSPKLFSEIFSDERDKWTYTEKGNPSFESDTLRKFVNPSAKAILEIRDAKSKLDFYAGFLYHADADDVIHPNFKQGGTTTGRLSSAEPNLQNLTSEDDEASLAQEFVVRRAFVPRPGHVFFMPDYAAMEYRVLLDYAKDMMIKDFNAKKLPWVEDYFLVANQVRDGLDIHQATADLMGVSRKYAKTLNFMLLYGGGAQKLADALGLALEDAIRLKGQYFKALPYVQFMITVVSSTVHKRGWIRNWAGRKYSFPDRNFAYTGCNRIVQGGCADLAKEAMNDIDEYLLDKKSKLLLSIHDEFVVECVEEEFEQVPKEIVAFMEHAYVHKHIPMKVDPEWSSKSLADKVKGFPI